MSCDFKIVIIKRIRLASRMRQLVPLHYSPKACMYHYLHMARGNYRHYLKSEQVRIKKYFYALRPILAINWLERDFGVVPTEFKVLVERVIESETLKQEIEKLIVVKEQGEELDYGPRIPVIGDFIDSEMARLEDKQFRDNSDKQPIDELNNLFRSALDEVWS